MEEGWGCLTRRWNSGQKVEKIAGITCWVLGQEVHFSFKTYPKTPSQSGLHLFLPICGIVEH
jgi:hypothetical protein